MSEWQEYVKGAAATISDHPADLYRFDRQAQYVEGFDNVGPAELARFHQTGYLAIQTAFNDEEVQAALNGLLDLIDGKNPAYEGLHFEDRAKDQLHLLTREEKQDAVRKVWKFVEYDARLKALSAHPKLLSVVSRLMNDTPFMFQDMALLKPPRIGREKPWHQDTAYFDIPHSTVVVGAWIALDEATVENGCMHILPGSHLNGPIVHFKRRDWQICDRHVKNDNDTVVPLRPGGVLLFHGLMHHGTPTNYSPNRRRALQYHYRPANCGQINTEERLAVFGGEGRNVEC
jgi:phytanoyl-CoA hydroxylase